MTAPAIGRDLSFDWQRYLASRLPALPGLQQLTRATTGATRTKAMAAVRKYRRDACRDDPLLFALVYLRHHLHSEETDNQISFSQFHLDMCERAVGWVDGQFGPMQDRSAWVGPRGSGKSTWTFLVLPLWSLAYGHRRFVAAFADSGNQAEQHLTSLKMELDNNQQLRDDFPGLCTPATRPAGTTVADNRGLYVSSSGATFMARGIDSSTLGAKLANQRPDLLLFDDVEPDEANYSEYQKEKRLGTIINAVFPMNDRAVVMIAGTVVMPGSIIHDLVRQVLDNETSDELPNWPREENIDVHYYPALSWDDNGEPVSLWPERWSVDLLLSIMHTRSFTLNMQNDPRGRDGDYWNAEDFQYGTLNRITKIFCWVDPPVTVKRRSDPAGVAIVGFSPARRTIIEGKVVEVEPPRAVVYQALEIRKTGKPLAEQTAKVIEAFQRQTRLRVGGVLVEANNGGDLWYEVFGPALEQAGIPMLTFNASESKEVRFARALDYYQRGLVLHVDRLTILEQQQVGFPKTAHDDVVDAACAGVLHWLEPKGAPRPRSKTEYPV